MSVKVVYCSRSGNTKLVADAIAEAAGVAAVSVTDEGAAITEPVDVLFVGGALYAHSIDKNLKAYLAAVPEGNVKKAVAFSTASFSKHAIDVIKKALKAKGIDVADDFLFIKKTASDAQLEEAKAFAKKFI